MRYRTGNHHQSVDMCKQFCVSKWQIHHFTCFFLITTFVIVFMPSSLLSAFAFDTRLEVTTDVLYFDIYPTSIKFNTITRCSHLSLFLRVILKIIWKVFHRITFYKSWWPHFGKFKLQQKVVSCHWKEFLITENSKILCLSFVNKPHILCKTSISVSSFIFVPP